MKGTRLVADALVTAQAAGATGTRVLGAAPRSTTPAWSPPRPATAAVSITAGQDQGVRKAITTIEPQTWTPIKYTNAVFDEDQQRWISDAQVAEIGYTAVTSRVKAKQVTARLIVRRVPDLNPAHQGVLSTAYRY